MLFSIFVLLNNDAMNNFINSLIYTSSRYMKDKLLEVELLGQRLHI